MSHLGDAKESLTQPPIAYKLQVEMLNVQWCVSLHQLGEEFMCNGTHDYHVVVIQSNVLHFSNN